MSHITIDDFKDEKLPVGGSRFVEPMRLTFNQVRNEPIETFFQRLFERQGSCYSSFQFYYKFIN